MTDVPRYLVRKGAASGQWMIWDRSVRGPAKLKHGFAKGLSEEWARQIIEELRQVVLVEGSRESQ
jgi:hypothetical protein